MVAAKVTYEMLVNAYEQDKYNGLSRILGKDENGIVRVTKTKNILQRIFDFFEKQEKK